MHGIEPGLLVLHPTPESRPSIDRIRIDGNSGTAVFLMNRPPVHAIFTGILYLTPSLSISRVPQAGDSRPSANHLFRDRRRPQHLANDSAGNALAQVDHLPAFHYLAR